MVLYIKLRFRIKSYNSRSDRLSFDLNRIRTWEEVEPSSKRESNGKIAPPTCSLFIGVLEIWTLEKSAFFNFAPAREVRTTRAPLKSAPLRSVLPKSAHHRFAFDRSTPEKSPLVQLAFQRSVSDMSTPFKIARRRFTPAITDRVNELSLKSKSLKSAPVNLTLTKSISEKSTLLNPQLVRSESVNIVS
ncbi:hypothetical protein Hhis01_00995 [Haloarcula hispanica]